MEYRTYQTMPSYANSQAIQAPQLNPSYVGDFSHPESCNLMPYLPIQQAPFYPTPISNMSNSLLERCTWSAEDPTLSLAALAEEVLVDPLLHGQPGTGMQNSGEQGSARVASSLEARLTKFEKRCGSLEDRIGQLEEKLGGFEELMQNLRNEAEDKTRFFEEVKAYNEKLVAWSKDSRQIVDGLVANLKEEVELAKSR